MVSEVHNRKDWIACQIGARENYAVPRAMHQRECLQELITDLWSPPGSRTSRKVGDRFHPDLANANVRSANFSFFRLEAFARATRLRDWNLITKRNRVFQDFVVDECKKFAHTLRQPKVFAYSYAAKQVLKFAKQRSWQTVLGQIDAGPVEERIVSRLSEESGNRFGWKPAPTSYWEDWQEECDLADRIIINSQWSRSCLMEAGVNDSKLFVVPLAYQLPITNTPITREYPPNFTPDRPLRVLFLGQISLRKGIARLLSVARSLQSQTIEFLMVGPTQITIPEDLRSNRKIRWVGPVGRNSVRSYYEQADVFILPTLSDGFGLTQLEALAHRLPVIASRQCGEVVTDGVNGLLLDEPTTAAIEEALLSCLHNPGQLAQFSKNATVGERFSLSCLGAELCALAM